ncbi:MAG: hypothetical protein AAGD14_00435 [Planctomycetota bacterium]
MRMLVAHYPRPDLPGRCVAVVTAIHTLPEPHIEEDQDLLRHYYRGMRKRRPYAGMLFEVRQVWQTEGGTPRLIEATIDLSEGFVAPARYRGFVALLGDARALRITEDITRSGHFHMYGADRRGGLLWCDRSYGLGEPEPFMAEYEIGRKRRIERSLPPALVAQLKNYVTRF